MAQHIRTKAPLRFLAAISSLLTIALCGASTDSWAQWDIDAMLATKTDWFAHQCYVSPEDKVVTFMAVGDYKLFSFVFDKNKLTSTYEVSATYDLDHKKGEWKVAGEQAFGRGDEIKKEMRHLSFKLLTQKQFAQMIKTEPKEECKD